MRASRTRRLLWPLVIPLLALTAPPARGAVTTLEGVPAFGHVFVIMGENTELGQISANNSPYLIGTICTLLATREDDRPIEVTSSDGLVMVR